MESTFRWIGKPNKNKIRSSNSSFLFSVFSAYFYCQTFVYEEFRCRWKLQGRSPEAEGRRIRHTADKRRRLYDEQRPLQCPFGCGNRHQTSNVYLLVYLFFNSLLQKPSCHRHRVQLNGETPHNSADCSGIGGHSCAQHGCFAPGSLVNFQKGERQMNMDWSLCEALATTNVGEISQVLHIYDINCQYQKHLHDCIQGNPLLSIPEHIKLIHAIGLFHVHGHKEECLYRWATSYVPGAGVIDGEVMETLWSVLNSISASTRTASLAHRTEILDDHMNDSNWKKMLHIGISLNFVNTSYIDAYPVKAVIRRYNKALESAVDARIALEQLTNAAPPAALNEWEASILEAELRRDLDASAMDIMHSKIKSGQTMKKIIATIM